VSTAATAGLLQGTGDAQFAPTYNMTRAMFAQALANLSDADLTVLAGRLPSFNDVSAAAWYFGAVEWASALGVVTGVGNGNFAPDAPITREQMAVMLYRYINMMGINIGTIGGANVPFADQNAVSPWAATAVNAVRAMGIMPSRADGAFDPRATATRAEVSAIFARLIALADQN